MGQLITIYHNIIDGFITSVQFSFIFQPQTMKKKKKQSLIEMSKNKCIS